MTRTINDKIESFVDLISDFRCNTNSSFTDDHDSPNLFVASFSSSLMRLWTQFDPLMFADSFS